MRIEKKKILEALDVSMQFFQDEGMAEVIPGVMLTPKLSSEFLFKISKFFGERFGYEGANCLGTISFSGGRFFSI